MSQLRLTNTRWGSKNLNVVAFSSPINGWIESAQTRTLVHHFPIKALQPELELEVVFRSEKEYEDFQHWVRNVQTDAQSNAIAPGVSIWWPQRSIYNWTGVIKALRAGGVRRDYAPHAKFTIDLIDSLVSSRTMASSWGSLVEEIYGLHTPGRTPESDSILTPAPMPNIPVQNDISTGENQLTITPSPVDTVGGSS